MAKSILDIIIKLSKEGGADKEVVKALVSVKSSILETAAVAGALVGAGIAIKKIFDETAGTFINYANEVRRVSDATGATAEDSSKLIQVLDDLKISEDELEKAVAKSGKTYDFSINGLAKMSDEYLKLNGNEERAAFMQERFGKQWISFVPVMQRGGQAIREAADSVEHSLILTQTGIDQARKYEIAVDSLNDAWTGLKISVGGFILPPVTDFLNGIRDTNRAIEIVTASGRNWQYITAQQRQEALATAAAEREHSDALIMVDQAQQDAATSADMLAQANKGILTDAIATTKSQDDYVAKQADVQKAIDELLEKKKKLYPWEKDKIDEINGKIEEQKQAWKDNEDAFKKAMTEKFALMTIDAIEMSDGAKGFSDTEMQKAKAVLTTLGITKEADIEQQIAQQMLLTALQNNILTVPEYGKAWEQVSADGVVSIDEVTAAILRIPKETHLSFIIDQYGSMPIPQAPNKKGKQAIPFAEGGSFIVPSAYGNEGFSLGGMATASAGEQITISPHGSPNIFSFYLNYSPGVSLGTRQEIMQWVEQGVRKMQAEGKLPTRAH